VNVAVCVSVFTTFLWLPSWAYLWDPKPIRANDSVNLALFGIAPQT